MKIRFTQIVKFTDEARQEVQLPECCDDPTPAIEGFKFDVERNVRLCALYCESCAKTLATIEIQLEM